MSNFILSIETKQLLERLIKTKVGELVTYKEMTKIVGRDIRKEGSSIMYSARRKAVNDCQIVFITVTNKGIKRASDEEIANSGSSVIHKIRRTSHKGKKVLHCVENFGSLTNESKIHHNASASFLGAIDLMTRPKKIIALEEKVKEESNSINVMKTLELFK
ncbi:MAG TPA: hypothetical protein VMX17_00035 [Candidatus Glassbacteria bacterium]|nr:hypothetical protein [Candidatus Glassbacteria bacterium]